MTQTVIVSECTKCGGSGKIAAFAHRHDGICYRCQGVGKITPTNPAREPKRSVMDTDNRYLSLVKRITDGDRLIRVYVIKDEDVAKKIRLKANRGKFVEALAKRGYTFSDYQFKPGRKDRSVWFLKLES
jgi:hypothetical protein